MGSSKFNSDIAYEILSRTYMKELDLCKTVCNEWNDISFESNFTSTHCERTGAIYGYFVQGVNNELGAFVAAKESNMDNILSFDFLPTALRRSDSTILASTKQGILLCKSNEYKKECFFVCKPSTQQWRTLPSPRMRFFTEKFGIAVVGSDPLHYKIMRISNPRESVYINNMGYYYCEMFDSKTWRWRRLNDIWLPYFDFLRNQPCVVVGDSIYSLLSSNDVLEFNTHTENHTIFPLPQPLTLNPQLMEYKGKLGLVSDTEDPYVYMRSVLESYKTCAWGKIEILSLERLRWKDDLRWFWFRGFLNADIVVLSDNSTISFYNLRNDTFQKFKVSGGHKAYSDNVFMFRSDLVPTQLNGRMIVT